MKLSSTAGFLGSLFLCSIFWHSFVLADNIDPIVIKGNKFFYKNKGTEFYIKGVAYQASLINATETDSTFIDPLADVAGCKRDIPYLVGLGINTLRVYAINSTLDHSECMQMLQDNGIYVVSDLSEPNLSINRENPVWDVELYQRYTTVVDALAKYDNVIGFFAGNEVTNNNTNTDASAFVKAAVRDTKAYIKAKGYNQGVGYSTNDDSDIREPMAEYFNCGDQSSAIDFYGVNMYEWCGYSSYTKSGYDERTAEFKNFSVPVFLSEFGCNLVEPRPFTEVQAIYGSNMTSVFSGGIVYMYFQEENDYGLVVVSDNEVSTRQDYENLKTELASVSPTILTAASFTPTNSPAACPTPNSDWLAATKLPPSPNADLCQCMVSSLQCVVSNSVDEKDFGSLFGTVCGLTKCTGIVSNGTAPGTYGAYSMCNPKDQLSWAFNQYYLAQNKAATACNFNGSATTQAAAKSPSGSCAGLLSEAGGPSGTGVVTDSPVTGTGGSDNHNAANSYNTVGGSWKIAIGFVAAFIGGGAFMIV